VSCAYATIEVNKNEEKWPSKGENLFTKYREKAEAIVDQIKKLEKEINKLKKAKSKEVQKIFDLIEKNKDKTSSWM
jgi:methyl-accepting chemotaxis protein